MRTYYQSLSALSLTCLLRTAVAQLTPTTPGPNETYVAGYACTIAWEPDASGTWTNVSIDFMTGSNLNMTLLTNVISGMDGTATNISPFNWTCPEVDPYSAIYFYQFTNGEDISNRTWTTRFTIASPDNQTVPPPESQQPSGDAIPWGEGILVSTSNQTLSCACSGTTDTPTMTVSQA